ncbi:MAG: hypothetical protein ABJB11_04495 [Ferruginibacter sp.]
MTKDLIKEQIEDIRKLTEEVTKSKEAANQFLIDAGIFLEDNSQKEDNNLNEYYCAPCTFTSI